ncbi:helix-turn-helix transcriptional regulator [Listeria sp. FSL L7-1485]|uniref:Helix-turn-helix transcriptional regulator n=1 Tax=Listeria immobilis TaxID=2713502 RepID=A0A7X1CAC8_9LIST|nr:helix-turn-helix transcriptional regulator [Listeria immobilis]MBC1490157.1 helix-turn-helix transcriptional regulator [Listeria immobilis]MBC1537244.1 helix-turn-helix transcriptional regulator [Listeria immobilis]
MNNKHFLKHISKTLQKIRKGKQLKLTDIQGINKSTLANLESSDRIPSLENFFIIANNLDITANETFFIHNHYQLTEKEQIINSFKKVPNSTATEQLLQIKNDIKQYMTKNGFDQYLDDLLLITECYMEINSRETFMVANPKAYELLDRLNAKKIWTYQDMYMASKIFFCFPPETAEELINRILSSLFTYRDFENIGRFHCTFLQNCGHYFYELGQYRRAKEIILEAIDTSNKNSIIITYISSKFILLEIEYHEIPSKREKIEEEVQFIVETLKYLQRANLSTQLEKDFQELKKKIKKQEAKELKIK